MSWRCRKTDRATTTSACTRSISHSGTELFSGPVDIEATYPGTGDNTNGTRRGLRPQANIRNAPRCCLLNGVIYTAWASHCDDRPVHRMDHGLQRIHAGADERAECHSQRQRRRHLDGRSRVSPPTASGNIYFLDANGDFDTTVNAERFPERRRLRQRLHEALDHGQSSACRRLFRDGQRGIGERQRHRPRLRRRDRAARPD